MQDQRITFALRQALVGARVEENCRKFGISQATFYDLVKTNAGAWVL